MAKEVAVVFTGGTMGKIMLRCDSCRYKFSRAVVPNLCPFCGKASVSKDAHSSAESILREVDELESRMR